MPSKQTVPANRRDQLGERWGSRAVDIGGRILSFGRDPLYNSDRIWVSLFQPLGI